MYVFDVHGWNRELKKEGTHPLKRWMCGMLMSNKSRQKWEDGGRFVVKQFRLRRLKRW